MRSNRKITDFISPSRARSESPTTKRQLNSPDIEVSSVGSLGDFDMKNDLLEISSVVGAQILQEKQRDNMLSAVVENS